MLPAARSTVRSACEQYGPGRLPGADRPDVGAGYAAASAAVFATVLFGVVLSSPAVGTTSREWLVSFLFPALALPVVVPSSFLLGVVGWRLAPSSSSITGIVAGGVGAVATYLVSFVVVGGVLTAGAALSLSSTTLPGAVEVSVSIVVLAFLLTWWVTIPVGCLSGLVYMNVTEKAANAT